MGLGTFIMEKLLRSGDCQAHGDRGLCLGKWENSNIQEGLLRKSWGCVQKDEIHFACLEMKDKNKI